MSTVFVTGASAGFGAAISRRYAAAGWRVVATARRLDRLKSLAEPFPGQILPLELDVRDREAVEAVVASLPSEFAEVDVLVDNAGLALGLDPAFRASTDQWQQMIDTNCAGVVYCARALLPGMVERGRGHVVVMGSIAGTYPYPGGNVYGATKAFTHQFAMNLRADLAGTGVRVSSIEPGLVGGTEFSVVRFDGDADRVAGLYEGADALGPDDVAEAVWWVTNLPPHVNINVVEMMPVSQSFGPLPIARKEPS